MSVRDDRNDVMDLMMVLPRKMGTLSKAMVSRYLKDTRLKSHHLMILNGISRGDGVSQRDLGECLPFDKSYISTGVRELIDMEYVRNDAEGKIHSLRLTESGREIVAMTEMMFDMIEGSLFEVLTQEERDLMRAIMEKIDRRSDELIERFSERQDS